MSDKAENSPSSSLEPELSELQLSESGTGEAAAGSGEIIYSKQPVRQSNQTGGKAADPLRRTMQPRSSGASVSSSLQASGQQLQQQLQQTATSSSINPAGVAWGCDAAQPAFQQQHQGFEDSNENFDSLLDLLQGPSETLPNSNAGMQLPGSTADIVISAIPSGPVQMPPPVPPPQPPRISPAAAATPNLHHSGVPSGATASLAAGATGAFGKSPVSESVRLALLKKINPQSILVDENFNTQLHTAVLQNQPRDAVDFLLCNLKREKKLWPVINLVSATGHTPLSLSLKMRRADLIPLLIDFDAAPTQLCCSASERTNHFHYAFGKCLDSVSSVQMVQSLIRCVANHHQSDLLSLHARDRCRKTPLDYLNHRISQLRSSQQQDPTSTELLTQMDALKMEIYNAMPRVESEIRH